MIIGLTGSIGSGKSTVSQRLAALGAHVLDADAVSRALTQPGGEALAAIAAAFGPGILRESGAIDRRALAAAAFSDTSARERLNAILHPLVLHNMRQSTQEILAADPHVCIVWDVPLLIEAGWQGFCDAVWLVLAPEQTRISRVLARDHCTREEALSRIRAQMSDEDKARFATHIIQNDGDFARLYARVDALYQQAEGDLL